MFARVMVPANRPPSSSTKRPTFSRSSPKSSRCRSRRGRASARRIDLAMQWLILLIFGGLVIALAVLSYYQNRKRVAELTAWAEKNGLHFNDSHDDSIENRFASFGCFGQGSARYGFNIMQGTNAGRETCALDYHYET